MRVNPIVLVQLIPRRIDRDDLASVATVSRDPHAAIASGQATPSYDPRRRDWHGDGCDDLLGVWVDTRDRWGSGTVRNAHPHTPLSVGDGVHAPLGPELQGFNHLSLYRRWGERLKLE